MKHSALKLQVRRRMKAHATLHWFPATSQVALISSHIRWDGRGSLLMLHELLSALETPTVPTVFDGSEAKNLVPALGTVIGMPENIKTEWEKRAAEISQPFIDAQPSLGLLPPGGLRVEPGDTKRVEIVLSSDRSKALREAARKQGLSMSTVVQTAAIMALSLVNDPDSQPENFASWIPTDLRKYCPQPFGGPVHAPSLRISGFPLIVKSRGSWSDISQAASKLNKTFLDMKDNDLMFIREPYVRISIGMFEAVMAQPELPPSTDSMLSALGILDDYIKHHYGSFVVQDVSMMVHIAAPSICFHYWSWGGELHLSANYDVAHYNADYIQKYLDGTKDIMVENLLGKDAV